MKNLSKILIFGLALLSLYGCTKEVAKKEDRSRIFVQDTIDVQIKDIKNKKREISDFYSKSNKLVVFYTMQGCEPCEGIYPYFKKKAKEYSESYLFGREDEILNRFLNPRIKKHEIYSAPTVIIWDKDSVVSRLEGSKDISNNLERELLKHSE